MHMGGVMGGILVILGTGHKLKLGENMARHKCHMYNS